MANPSLTDLLTEAKAARHALLTGTAVASARDQNGEEVRYTQADRSALTAYIAELEALIAAEAGSCLPGIGPMRTFF